MTKANSLCFRSTGILFVVAILGNAAAQEAPSASGVPAHILVTVEPKHGSNSRLSSAMT